MTRTILLLVLALGLSACTSAVTDYGGGSSYKGTGELVLEPRLTLSGNKLFLALDHIDGDRPVGRSSLLVNVATDTPSTVPRESGSNVGAITTFEIDWEIPPEGSSRFASRGEIDLTPLLGAQWSGLQAHVTGEVSIEGKETEFATRVDETYRWEATHESELNRELGSVATKDERGVRGIALVPITGQRCLCFAIAARLGVEGEFPYTATIVFPDGAEMEVARGFLRASSLDFGAGMALGGEFSALGGDYTLRISLGDQESVDIAEGERFQSYAIEFENGTPKSLLAEPSVD